MTRSTRNRRMHRGYFPGFLFVVFIGCYCFFGRCESLFAKDFESRLNLASLLDLVDNLNLRIDDSAHVCAGRLTLASGTPVTTSDLSSQSSIYYAPYNGNSIALYVSSAWTLLSFAQLTIAVPSTTNTPFDIFGYSNSGTLALTTVNWTNATTRSTAITMQNGIYVESGVLTNRYLGSGVTSSSSGKTNDQQSSRLIWNMCNRVPRMLFASVNTASWTYGTAAWRATNSNTTVGQEKAEFILGLSLEPVKIEQQGPYGNIISQEMASSIGIDSSTTNSGDLFGTYGQQLNLALSYYAGWPGVGYHYAQSIETSNTTFTTTFHNYSANHYQAGMSGKIWQ